MNARSRSHLPVTGLALIAILVAACGGSAAPAATAAPSVAVATASAAPTPAPTVAIEKTLRVGWYGGNLAPAFKDVVVDPFQKATGIQVTVETANDDVRLTKLRAQPGSLDVAFFTDPIMSDVRAANVPTPLSDTTIPRLKDVYPVLRAKDAFAWSFGVWGIAYNADKVKPAPTSWADMLDPQWKGKVTGPDITYNSSILSLIALAKLGGGGQDKLDPGFEKMQQLRTNSAFFWPASAQLLQQLQSGAVWMSAFASGSTFDAADAPGAPPIRFVTPKEGGYPIPFNLVIPAKAQSPNAAAAFANFVLDPDVQAKWAARIYYAPANQKTTIPAAVKDKILSGAAVNQLQIVDWEAFAKQRAVVVQKWQSTIK